MSVPDIPSRSGPAAEGHADHPRDERGDDDVSGHAAQAAKDAQDWIASLDDEVKRSLGFAPDPLGRITAAMTALAADQATLDARVAEARAHGHSWTHIAAALHTSPYAAAARYSPSLPAPPTRSAPPPSSAAARPCASETTAPPRARATPPPTESRTARKSGARTVGQPPAALGSSMSWTPRNAR